MRLLSYYHVQTCLAIGSVLICGASCAEKKLNISDAASHWSAWGVVRCLLQIYIYKVCGQKGYEEYIFVGQWKLVGLIIWNDPQCVDGDVKPHSVAQWCDVLLRVKRS